MLSENSILLRLPPGINSKQLVFLDGIRHAVEITDLAYSRLESTLTWLVMNTHDSAPEKQAYTSAFLDAWAVVDAIDRFRLLWKELPRAPVAEKDPNSKSFDEIAQPVRNLRNVADHLAQRADYVAASPNPVLGLLSWVTFPAENSDDGFTCVLAPGTRGKGGEWRLVTPGSGGHFSVPRRTGNIHLAAGEHRANLSAILPEMQVRVEELEHALEEQIRGLGLEGKQSGGDYFFALAFKAGSIDTSPPTKAGDG